MVDVGCVVVLGQVQFSYFIFGGDVQQIKQFQKKEEGFYGDGNLVEDGQNFDNLGCQEFFFVVYEQFMGLVVSFIIDLQDVVLLCKEIDEDEVLGIVFGVKLGCF